jgi:hypothetical protein
MNKRLLKVAVTTALTVAFAVPAFANPFTDVPAKHWAYDAVNKLAQAGVISGYGDGTFKGDKTVSRYEMASMVATAMQKNLNDDQKKTVDQLSKEFATELTGMGIKVDSLDKKVDNMVKVSGDARVRYGEIENGDSGADFRARVSFDGKINDDLKFNARLTSGNIDASAKTSGSGQGDIILDTANVTFNALGLTNTIGRQDVKAGNNAFLFDTQANGLATSVNGLKLFAGKYDNEDLFTAQYATKLNGVKLAADYVKLDDQKIYGANTSFALTKGVSANAEYYKNQDTDAQAYAYGVKFDKIGLGATYRNIEAGSFTKKGTMTADLNTLLADDSASFKGMEYTYDREIAKNTVLNVKYQAPTDGDARTAATVNVKF